jgi:hypothetical protein
MGMHTGTLIEELMATVERTTARADARRQVERSQKERLAYWYLVAQQEVAHLESSLAGVA